MDFDQPCSIIHVFFTICSFNIPEVRITTVEDRLSSFFIHSLFSVRISIFLLHVCRVLMINYLIALLFARSISGRLGARVVITLRESLNNLVNTKKQETEEKTD